MKLKIREKILVPVTIMVIVGFLGIVIGGNSLRVINKQSNIITEDGIQSTISMVLLQFILFLVLLSLKIL